MTRGEAVNWLINITADIGKAEHRELWHYEQALSEIREMLESEPERKKGKWIRIGHFGRSYKCNQCGNSLDFDGVNVGRGDANFCPNCGADMRGDKNERIKEK